MSSSLVRMLEARLARQEKLIQETREQLEQARKLEIAKK